MYSVLLPFLRSLAVGFPQQMCKSKVGSYFCSPMAQVRYAKDMVYSLLQKKTIAFNSFSTSKSRAASPALLSAHANEHFSLATGAHLP